MTETRETVPHEQVIEGYRADRAIKVEESNWRDLVANASKALEDAYGQPFSPGAAESYLATKGLLARSLKLNPSINLRSGGQKQGTDVISSLRTISPVFEAAFKTRLGSVPPYHLGTGMSWDEQMPSYGAETSQYLEALKAIGQITEEDIEIGVSTSADEFIKLIIEGSLPDEIMEKVEVINYRDLAEKKIPQT